MPKTIHISIYIKKDSKRANGKRQQPKKEKLCLPNKSKTLKKKISRTLKAYLYTKWFALIVFYTQMYIIKLSTNKYTEFAESIWMLCLKCI